MKRLAVYLFLIYLNAGCSQVSDLTQKEARKILVNELNYPRIVDYEIYCSDPEHAKKILNTTLEDEGFVEIIRMQKIGDIGKPLVRFTTKAKPYLLYVDEKQKSLDIQRVKIAEENITHITILKGGTDANTITVEYTTSYAEITPFAVLLMNNKNESRKRKALFTWRNEKWLLIK